MSRWWIWGATGALVIGAALWATDAWASGYEAPEYAVVEDRGAFEVREYAPWIKAEVTVAGSQDQSARAAFRILAGYIFGDNAPSEKIGMTAPVGQEPQGEKIGMTVPVGQEQAAESGQWVVWFMMPSRYTLQTLPEPADDRIRLREQPAHRAAVLAFRGRIREGTFERRAAELEEAVAAAGLDVAGEPTYAQYSPPMLPGFLRRNEVIVQLQ